MADPTKYVKDYSYTGWQSAHPGEPLPAPQVDNDFSKLELTTTETIDALADIRREDGALNNGIVTPDSFKQPEIDEYLSQFPQTAQQSAEEAFASAEAAAASAVASDASADAAAVSAAAANADRVVVETLHGEVDVWHEELLATDIPGVVAGIQHVTTVLSGVSQIVADDTDRGTDSNNSHDLVSGVVDDAGKIMHGVDAFGGEWIGDTFSQPLPAENSMDIVFGVMGTNDKVSWAVDDHGGQYLGTSYSEPLGVNQLDIVWGYTDANNRLMWGFDEYGGEWLGGSYSEPLPTDNSLGLVWGVADMGGRVALGVDGFGGEYSTGVYSEALGVNNLDLVLGVWGLGTGLLWGVDEFGGEHMGGAYSEPVPDDNNLGLAWGVVGSNNKVALGVTKTGQVIGLGSAAETQEDIGAVVWETGGDIYGLLNATEIQITDDGLNSLPRVFNGDKVLFRSTRNGGTPRTFEVDYAEAGEDTPRLVYKTRKRNEVIIGIGQSLMANNTSPGISLTQEFPDNALKFPQGPIALGATPAGTELVPLVERADAESYASGLAKQVLSTKLDRRLVIAGAASGGKTDTELRPGGTSGCGENIEDQVDALAQQAGGFHCRAVMHAHGEANDLAGGSDYHLVMRDWKDELDATIMAKGQAELPIWLVMQSHTAASYWDLSIRDNFGTPLDQHKACRLNDDMFLVMPMYIADCVDHGHFESASARLIGEYIGKVYRIVCIEGRDWKPLQVRETVPGTPDIAIVGNTIVIDLDVPVGPLQFNTTLVADPGDYGFNLRNSGGATITNVAITGAAQITITCSAPPAPGWKVSYAFHNGPSNGCIAAGVVGGRLTGSRGCVFDSDPTLSQFTGEPLINPLCVFVHTFT